MILYQKDNPDEWFSWDSKTMKHYYPNMNHRILGPTKWNLEYNLEHGTTIVAPDLLGWWQDD